MTARSDQIECWRWTHEHQIKFCRPCSLALLLDRQPHQLHCVPSQSMLCLSLLSLLLHTRSTSSSPTTHHLQILATELETTGQIQIVNRRLIRCCHDWVKRLPLAAATLVLLPDLASAARWISAKARRWGSRRGVDVGWLQHRRTHCRLASIPSLALRDYTSKQSGVSATNPHRYTETHINPSALLVLCRLGSSFVSLVVAVQQRETPYMTV